MTLPFSHFTTSRAIRWALLAAVGGMLFSTVPSGADQREQPAGSAAGARWAGYLVVSESDSLDLVIDIMRLAGGHWLGEVDVPDAGFVDLPYSCFVQGNTVTLRAANSQFLGTLSDDGRTLSGRLIQEGEKLAFVTKRVGNPQISGPTLESAGDVVAQQPLPEHTIPIDVGRRGPVMVLVVDAVLNGHGPYRLVLDINNDVTLLSQSLIDALELPRHEEVVQGEDETRAQIRTLQLADVTLANVEAIPFDFSRTFYANDPPDGMLGFSVLSDFLTTIDLSTSEFTLTRGELPADGNDIIPYRMDDEMVPVVTATVAGRLVDAQLSIVTRSPVSLPEAYMDSVTLSGEPARIGRLSSSKGEFPILSARFEGRLEIGGHSVDLPAIRFSNVYERADIGYSTLDEFALTFDQKNQRLRIVRSDITPMVQVRAAGVRNLSEDLPVLRTAFNADPDNVRLILILAPTHSVFSLGTS